MQNLPIYLYQNLLDVTLDLDVLVTGVNRDMYQRPIEIQKGLKNNIKIQFRNSDQKKVKIYNTHTYVFSMFDAINQRLLIEKPLDIIDDDTTATKGLALLTLTESDTLDLDKSSYSFSIKRLDSDGSYVPTYANTYYGVAGTLNLRDDVYPKLQPSVSVSDFLKSFNSETLNYQYSSGNIYASPEFNGNNALHTVAFYLTGYRGTVNLQATLDNNPGNGTSYSTIFTKQYSGFTGIDTINFTGVYSYIRVIHIPDRAPGESDNDNSSYFGKFDKLLFRS